MNPGADWARLEGLAPHEPIDIAAMTPARTRRCPHETPGDGPRSGRRHHERAATFRARTDFQRFDGRRREVCWSEVATDATISAAFDCFMTGWWSVDAMTITGYLPIMREPNRYIAEKLTDIIFFHRTQGGWFAGHENARPEVLRKLTARAHAKSAGPHLRGWLDYRRLRADDGQQGGPRCSAARGIARKHNL